MREKVKVVNSIGDIMFEVLMPDSYIQVLTKNNKISKYAKSIKKVPIGTGNAGKSLEYEAVYDGFQVPWPDFKQVADTESDI